MVPDLSGGVSLHDVDDKSNEKNADSLTLNRIISLDVLRGIAVLFALFISIVLFGSTNNYKDFLLTHVTGGKYFLWAGFDLLLNGKMLALIAFVFGAGMIVLVQRKHATVPTADLFIRRQLWLLLFGLINALVFLWTNDLLFHLGIMGILLFAFTRLPVRSLVVCSIAAALILSAKNYWSYTENKTAYSKYLGVVAAEKKISRDSLARATKNAAVTPPVVVKTDSLSKQQKEDKAAWENLLSSYKYDEKKDKNGFTEIRSASYSTIWNHLLPVTQSRQADWTYKQGIWALGSMILLGMAAFKWKFFGSEFPRRKYLLIAVAGIVLGLAAGCCRIWMHHNALVNYTRYISGHSIPHNLFFPFECMLLAGGYAALVLWLIRTSWLNLLWHAFASAGRLSLTNYLVQSIACGLLFTGFGLGYYGRMSEPRLYFVALELTLIQLVFSIFWVRYFAYGPAEWLLRCLVHWKWLPNKLNQPVTPATPVLS